MTKADIIKALPKLTAAELAEVQTAIKMLLALSGVSQATPTANTGDGWLLAAIADLLVQRGVIAPKNAVFGLRRRDAFRQYQEKLPDVMHFLLSLQKQYGGGKRDQITLGFICATALADLLDKRNYFSVSAMLSQVDKIPEALDQAFPGYVKGGLFGFLMKRLEATQ